MNLALHGCFAGCATSCTCAQVKELGRGCFGSVWLAKWRGVEVALKELLNPGSTDTNAVEVRQHCCTGTC